MPVYADRFNIREQKKYEKSGATWMWSCTACWDNFMKATTLEEAIEEFEQLYMEKRWQAIEGCKKSLDDAIDSFRAFDQYRKNKR